MVLEIRFLSFQFTERMGTGVIVGEGVINGDLDADFKYGLCTETSLYGDREELLFGVLLVPQLVSSSAAARQKIPHKPLQATQAQMSPASAMLIDLIFRMT